MQPATRQSASKFSLAQIVLTLSLTACVGEPFEEDDLFTGGAGGEAGGAGAAGQAGAGSTGGSAGSGGAAGTAGGTVVDAGPDADAPEPCPVIEVKSAVYAASCGVATTLSTVFTECDGLTSCEYAMLMSKDPGSDIASQCWKDLTVVYSCGAETKSVYLDKTWDGLVVKLACECPS